MEAALNDADLYHLQREARTAPRRFRKLLRRLTYGRSGRAAPAPPVAAPKPPAPHRPRHHRPTLDRQEGEPYFGVRKIGKARWTARYHHQGDDIHIGSFDSPEDAGMARDRKAIELVGPTVALNFPHLRSEVA